MAVTVDLPADVEKKLRADTPDLEFEAKEAMLVELYRQDKLSHHELSLALGLERFETDAVLKKHHGTEDLPTDEEYNAALAHIDVRSSHPLASFAGMLKDDPLAEPFKQSMADYRKRDAGADGS